MTSYHKGKILKAAYRLARGRDDYACMICGTSYAHLPYSEIVRYLDVHHVLGRAGKLLFDPRFMSSLCSDFTKEKCHNQKFHKHIKYWRPILLKKLEEKYTNMSDEEKEKYNYKEE